MDWQKDEKTTQVQPCIRHTQTDRWKEAFFFEVLNGEKSMIQRNGQTDGRMDQQSSADPEGGQGVWTPLESHKLYGFQ